MRSPSPRIGIVAGEASGDHLGAALMTAIRRRRPDAEFFGMAGPRMLDAGCRELAHIDQLSVMGLVEVLRSYPRLVQLRRRLVSELAAAEPDVVIGIDVPDFNLGLERRLKQQGVATVHYVCPQAWAWRPKRALALARSADRLLALLPFEVAFFEGFGVKTHFVGHPLADALPLVPDRQAARAALGLAQGGPVIALMPGSRRQELERLLETFLAAGRVLLGYRPDLRFALCCVREQDVAQIKRAAGALPLSVFVGRPETVLTAADVAIVASGTVTLEALLCGTPMLVGYRLAPLSYHIIKRMVTVPHIALPNILAGYEMVPEYIQNEMTADNLAGGVMAWLGDEQRRDEFARRSRELHGSMRCNAAAKAADAVLELVGSRA